MSLATWTTQLSEALGIEIDVEIDDLLDIARDAAHQIDRPAAPLTTFLIGYAAATRGGSPGDVADCIDITSELISAEGSDDD